MNNPVLIEDDGDNLYVSFRGTDMYSGSNWWTNTTIRTRKFSDYDMFKKRMNLDKLSDLEIHKGFADAMLITYDTVRLEIDTYRGRNLILTGHSLGGAMANLFYYIYERDVINVEKKLPITHCVTFGSPRSIRNYEPYSIRYNTQCPNNIRIFNKLDIVPYLPRRRAMTDFDNTSDDIDEEFTKQYPRYKNEYLGFIHVGIPLCLDDSINFNDINNYLFFALSETSEFIKYILNRNKLTKDDSVKMMEMMSTVEWREALAETTIKCMDYSIQNPNINPFVLSNFLFDNFDRAVTYSEKCDVVAPMGLDKLFKRIGQFKDLDDTSLTILSTEGFEGILLGIHNHTLDVYKEKLNSLIAQEIINPRAIISGLYGGGDDSLKSESVLQAEKEIEIKNKIKVAKQQSRFAIPDPIGILIADADTNINYQFIEF